jgi:hypothetical protein
MITYKHNNLIYFYDHYIKSWTVYKVDKKGNQINVADYYPNKKRLIKYNPDFKFKKYIEQF